MTNMYRVRTEFTGLPGGTGLSTLWFINNGTLTAQDAADAVTTFWTNVRGIMSSQVAARGVPQVDTVNATTGQVISSDSVTAWIEGGTLSDNPLPWSTQLLVRWTTGFYANGRQVMGHMFIPGVTESLCNGDFLSGAYSPAASNAATLISDPDSELCVYSRTNHLAQIVTGATAYAKPAVLRSRRG